MKCWIWIPVLLGARALMGPSAVAEDWPAFRGPHGDGISSDKGFPTEWGPQRNIKWKVPLPSPANGSPIVADGRVLLTCCADDGRQRSLYCFDRQDGRELWVRTVTHDKEMRTHRTNPYGGSTPVSDGNRVVVWHSSAGLHCYDMAGTPLWSRDLGQFDHMWGYGSSPILHQGRVILYSGPGKRIFITALSLESGQTLWETVEPFEGDGDRRADGKYMGAWTTPVICRIDGSDQIVCTMPTRVVGYDPDSGEIIWSCDGIRGPKGDLAYSSPMIFDGFCVQVAGFGGPAIGFKLGGTGNITKSNRQWRVESNPQSIGTGVFLGNYVYRANAARPAPIQCVDSRTGEVVWDGPRGGGNCWASIVLADGLLYVTTQDATTFVVKPSPEKYVEVARNSLDETCNATPAFSEGEIFLRTYDNLYCIAK